MCDIIARLRDIYDLINRKFPIWKSHWNRELLSRAFMYFNTFFFKRKSWKISFDDFLVLIDSVQQLMSHPNYILQFLLFLDFIGWIKKIQKANRQFQVLIVVIWQIFLHVFKILCQPSQSNLASSVGSANLKNLQKSAQHKAFDDVSAGNVNPNQGTKSN